MKKEYQLDIIDLDQKLSGYRKFLSCWVYRSSEVNFIVDPGPASTVDYLISRLRDLGISRLDYVLLTHIHLDHAGGLQQILTSYKGARFYCHDLGRKHLLEPEKLWRGSLATIGDVASMYGQPLPVSNDRFASKKDLKRTGIGVLNTPGHAAHHLCFLFNNILFAGEAIATRMQLPDGREYLRPATPPKFILPISLDSISKLENLEPEPKKTAFAHYGLADGVRKWCKLAREQLVLWVDLLRELKEDPNNLEARFFEKISKLDPNFGQGGLELLDADIQEREKFYLSNAIKGMLGFLECGKERFLAGTFCINCDNSHGCRTEEAICLQKQRTEKNIHISGKSFMRLEGYLAECKSCSHFRRCWDVEEYTNQVISS